MYCIVVYDLDSNEVIEFWWYSTYSEAINGKLRYAVKYPAPYYEVSIETSGGNYSAGYAHACGYVD